MHILTLPITPKKTSSCTTLVTPFSASMCGLIHEVPVTIMLNTTGERIMRSCLTPERAYDWYIEQLSGIGIEGHASCRILHDGSEAYDLCVQRLLPSLEPSFREKSALIGCCTCGIVEIPMEVFKDIQKKSKMPTLLTKDHKGRVICKKCKCEVRPIKQQVLELQIKDRPTFSVWPEIYANECEATLNRIFRLPWYISREQRLSSQRYKICGGEWGIDTDLRWMLYPGYALTKCEGHVLLVSALSTLNQALRMMCVSRRLFPDLRIDLLVHPHMRIKDEGSPMSDMDIETFLREADDVRYARFFLALGLQWRHMDSVVRSSEFYLVRTTLARNTPLADSELRSPLRIDDVNRIRILQLLKRMRSGKNLSEGDWSLYTALAGA